MRAHNSHIQTRRSRHRRIPVLMGGVAFLPTDVDGLQLWLDANDASTLFQDAAKTIPAGNGDVVGAWADKSGLGNDATQTTTAAKPTLVNTDGFPALEFDGTDDYLINSSGLGIAGSAAFTYGFVFKQVTSTTSDRIFYHGDNLGAFTKKRTCQVFDLSWRFDGAFRTFNEVIGVINYRRTIWQGAAGANVGNHDLYLDNVIATEASAGAPATVINIEDDEFSVGAARSIAGLIHLFVNARLVEAFAYNKDLSVEERLQLDNYITNKWGI